jgi:ankyrin repeat protein
LDYDTPVMAASQNGHLDVVNALIKARADLNLVFPNETVLVSACRRRHDGGGAGCDNYQIVAALLAAGAPVHPPGASVSPLYFAIAHNALESAKLLIAAGADPNLVFPSQPSIKVKGFRSSPDGRGQNPLNLAISLNNLPAVQILLDAKADVNANLDIGYALETAVTVGNVAVVNALIASGAIVQGHFLHAVIECCDGGAWKRNRWEKGTYTHPVIDSQVNGSKPDFAGVMRALVDANADLTARDEQGFTPLMTAVRMNNVDAAKVLLAVGVSPNETRPDGVSALMLASAHGSVGVGLVSALVAAGADVNYISNGQTIVEMAESSDIKALLMEAGGKRWYELMAEKYKFVRAVVHKDLKLVDKLIIDADDEEKEVALMIAVQANEIDLVKRLLAGGVPTAVSFRGYSMLTVACASGYTRIVRELLDAGADISVVDNGKTPMQWAAQHRHRDVMVMLLAKANELKNANK